MGSFSSQNDMDFQIRACRDLTRQYARTFYFASFILPKAKREAAYVIYAFCRKTDNILDDAAEMPLGERLDRLDALRSELRKMFAGSPLMDRDLAALADVVRVHRIPEEPFLELLEGVAMDLTVSRYRSWNELELYCYRVASTVGLIMARLFGVASESAYPQAVDLGKAMQLTNILRDVKEDLERGRIYLPSEELNQFDCSEDMLERGRVTPEFVRLMKWQVARARRFYRSSDSGIPAVTGDGSRFCVRVMSSLYERILDVIERTGYDIFKTRAVVPFGEKLLHLAKIKMAGSGFFPPAKGEGKLGNFR